jgi:uncharacterized protein YbjT (DUF2867 family)
MKLTIIGANGFIGHNLISRLLDDTSHEIVGISRDATNIPINHKRLSKHDIDVFDTDILSTYLSGCSTVYYLIHMMGQKKVDFALAESAAAISFKKAAEKAGVKRVIFLGGLGDDNDNLSKHLSSRHKTGQLLKSEMYQVIEFRASMVIGKGSVAYDIITNLIHKLPVLTIPKWSKTLTQPIGLYDALSYLIAAIDLKNEQDLIVEIGGPEAMSYKELMRRYANYKNIKVALVTVSIIPVGISAWWLNLFTPKKHAKVGKAMVESLANPMTVNNDLAKQLFPDIKPRQIDDVFV